MLSVSIGGRTLSRCPRTGVGLAVAPWKTPAVLRHLPTHVGLRSSGIFVHSATPRCTQVSLGRTLRSSPVVPRTKSEPGDGESSSPFGRGMPGRRRDPPSVSYESVCTPKLWRPIPPCSGEIACRAWFSSRGTSGCRRFLSCCPHQRYEGVSRNANQKSRTYQSRLSTSERPNVLPAHRAPSTSGTCL